MINSSLLILIAGIIFFAAGTGCVILSISNGNRTRKRLLNMTELLIGMIEAGDPNLDGHSLHVHGLTMLLYDYLPLKYSLGIDRESLDYASLLIDIGKLGVSGKIIGKTGKLDNKEWELMRRHPELGANLIKNAGDFEKISTWVLYHHERVDGGGYYKLKKDEIPVPSRMMAIADTFSAITMARSYKPSYTYEDAMAELKLVAGSQLDEELVEIFCKIPVKRVASIMDDVHEKLKKYADYSLQSEAPAAEDVP